MKYVYSFEEGNKTMRNLLGGKGANLSEMTNLNMPVPKGFVVTTEACKQYYEDHEQLSETLKEEILSHIKNLEEKTKKKFGDMKNPLLVSVRSGAPVSMPGMMDTILNLGLNDEVASEFARSSGNARFVYDSYRRFISMYADVVKGYDRRAFEDALEAVKKEHHYKDDTDLTEKDMKALVKTYQKIYFSFEEEEFPQDGYTQLYSSIEAVFKSWNNDRAIYYRKLNDIPSDLGTAVNVQEMVYGNAGIDSGTGVAFTRNPSTGEKGLYGEYLMNAQGEDVVAGIRTPSPISKLKEEMPKIYEEFVLLAKHLEEHYKDMQDMEFTIEHGKLYLLQTRNGKRTGFAGVKIAVDMVEEGLLTKEEALLKVDPNQLNDFLHPAFSKEELKTKTPIATGLAASPGAACGKIYFNAKKVMEQSNLGEDVILVRLETSPEDIEGMHHAKGILTIRGGMTSHAAVVARGMGTPCVSGCENLELKENETVLKTKDGKVYHEGDYISIDGSTGLVYDGKTKLEEASINETLETYLSWADEVATMKVKVNADTFEEAKKAREFGAKGIGLCRTEHMFFNKERILEFRKMILSETKEEREHALEALLPYQIEDFKSLFVAMDGYDVVIRYLDPPLHEFLPKTKEEKEILAQALHLSMEQLEERIASLKEFNPMMGHRGCRLAITYPEIAQMQTKAVIQAALEVAKEKIHVSPKIMVPLIGDPKEFIYVKNIIVETANSLIENESQSISYEVGTMMEIPRACLLSNELAHHADFYSFGTNDLTQYSFGFSRDDAGKYLKDYYEKKIFDSDPFVHFDQQGIGKLMKFAIEEGRKENPALSIGVCGEHGGDPKSIEYFNKVGLDYVSCSTYRILIARLAVAQASIREKMKSKA